ncbi:aldehyde dehydrogenase family protein [Streptomyces sp. NPDC002386]
MRTWRTGARAATASPTIPRAAAASGSATSGPAGRFSGGAVPVRPGRPLVDSAALDTGGPELRATTAAPWVPSPLPVSCTATAAADLRRPHPETGGNAAGSARLAPLLHLLERPPDPAEVVAGGLALPGPGFFHQATALAGVRQEDEIFRGEVFGTVVTIQPFTRKGQDFGWRTPFRRLWPQAHGPATTTGPRARVERCIPASSR